MYKKQCSVLKRLNNEPGLNEFKTSLTESKRRQQCFKCNFCTKCDFRKPDMLHNPTMREKYVEFEKTVPFYSKKNLSSYEKAFD